MYFGKMTPSAMLYALSCLTNFLYGHYNLPICAFLEEFYGLAAVILGIAPKNGPFGYLWQHTGQPP
jgi:hypothetical protein